MFGLIYTKTLAFRKSYINFDLSSFLKCIKVLNIIILEESKMQNLCEKIFSIWYFSVLNKSD